MIRSRESCLLVAGWSLLSLLVPTSTHLAAQGISLGIANTSPAPVERTGQYECHDVDGTLIDCSSTLHDGQLRAGMEWPVPRFIDQGNGTVADQLTGLEWLQDGLCLDEENWSTALVSIDDLNSGTDFGCSSYTAGTFADWRLPNIKELLSLVDYSQTDPAVVTGHPFVNLEPSLYWSSTTFEAAPGFVFGVEFTTGAANTADKSSFWSAIAVRGTSQANSNAPVEETGQINCYDDTGSQIPCAGTGQDGELQAGVVWSAFRFVDNGDGTIRDALTGLTWLKDATCIGDEDWQAVLDLMSEFNSGIDFNCDEYDAGDYTDWRLPNIRDLHSLIDYSQASPAVVSGHPFLNLVDGIYWSSTTLDNSPSWAHDLDMESGISEGQIKINIGVPWPVRGGIFQAGQHLVDEDFGVGGYVSTDFVSNSSDSAFAAALQPDGKIIVVGSHFSFVTSSVDFALARYNPDGSLDPTFGSNGLVTTDLNASSADVAFNVAVHTDGTIVATGLHSASGIRDVGVVRYLSNGTLDGTFGTGGIVLTDIGDSERPAGVAVQPDGKVLVTSRVGSMGTDIALLRYTTAGILDLGFGNPPTGVVTIHDGLYDSVIGPPAITAGGRILVLGATGDGTTHDLLLAQFLSNGHPDAAFGTNGIATAEFEPGIDDLPSGGPLVLPNFKIVVAGTTRTPTDTNVAVTRFEPDGQVDIAFGTNGSTIVGLGTDEYTSGTPVLDAEGNIVISGEIGFGNQGRYLYEYLFGGRFLADGSVDQTLGTDGFVILSLGPGPYSAGVQALVTAETKIVWVGRTDTEAGNFALVRTFPVTTIFADDFESGDTSAWSATVP